MPSQSMRSAARERVVQANRWTYLISSHWMVGFSLVFGIFVGLPFLAPVLMNFGLEFPARIIYTIYSFLCHQLPQRSYFLFGREWTYPLVEIQAVWGDTTNLMKLRQFIGMPDMGWKVAWSDRMVSMYTSILLFAWVWYPIRNKIRALSWQGLIIFLTPMTVDGFSHMVSDLAGVGQGFRDSNAWLATLTNHVYSPAFYAGDGWGSFNSIVRLVSGILFGVGIVWFSFPYLDQFFTDMEIRIRLKFQKAGISIKKNAVRRNLTTLDL